MPRVVVCKLDSHGCLSLEQVVQSFHAPIKQEHGWAIIHQGMLSLLGVVGKPCFLVRGMEDILITKEGLLHNNTFTRGNHDRVSMTSMATGVAELGVAVYDALDWTMSEDISIERTLSAELENVLDVMTSADDLEILDEGIGEEEVTSKLCEKVLELCRHHLALPEDAAYHFQQVCRAIVAEVLELSSFMDKLSSRDLEELEQLDRQDWAGIFNEVMGELRHGVKLKSVEYSRSPTEFCLTPYEMLMFDINRKKAVLKPPLPVHVEKAAKEKILESIRSRPPLKPAIERKLNPPKQEDETPIENLMSEIRRGTARKSLRRTRVKRKKKDAEESFGKVIDKVKENEKKIIDLDETFATKIFNFEEESPDNSLESVPSSPEPNSGDENSTSGNEGKALASSIHEMEDAVLDELPIRDLGHLTLEEVGHIRSQITMAELERLDLSKDARKDYDKGRICVQCTKTRFNMFNWAYPCQLCKRQVCKSCCGKIKLPSLKLSDIPVSSLKSQLRPGGHEKNGSSYSGSGFGRGWQRTSLRSPRTPIVVDPPTFSRSKTMTKAEIDKMRETAFDAATVALGVNHDVCAGCKELLASMVGGRKGMKSPRKKSILDLQSLTITKRRTSANK